MHRRTALIALSVLAIVTLGLSAATVTNPVESPDDWGTDIDAERETWFDDKFDESVLPDERPIDVLAEPVVQDSLAGAIVLAVIGGIVYAFYSYRRARPYMLVGTASLAGLWLIVRHLEWNALGRLVAGFAVDMPLVWLPSVVVSALTDPTVLAVLALTGVLVLAIALVVTGGIRQPTSSTSVTDIGAAAGRAADTIDHSAGVTSAVHRAWADMVIHLDLDEPKTTTTREFAAAAIAAGMAQDDVEVLTTLFEAVRYGERPATPALERQAVRILRRIEATYEGSDG